MKRQYYIFSLLAIVACSSNLNSDQQQKVSLDDYWFQGKAELTSYSLQQARYGEIHEGEAVLIFVTEDFSKKKNVKLDNPSKNPDDRLPVLKMNMSRKFWTGLYPYSMMLSTFTPYEQPQNGVTKLTATSQEWCGHTFTQLEKKSNKYTVELYSYFESEGDQRLSLDKVVLEDEIWNMIRITPELLPTGDFEIIPGMLFQRLRHIPIKQTKAQASLSQHDSLSTYRISIPEFDRTISINFMQEAPHEIIGWEEEYVSGFGSEAKTMTTKAVMKKRIITDYWTKNSIADSTFRKQLDLKLY